MIVVADTSPLNYLVLIGEIDLLPALFGRVLIPHAVASELVHPRTPESVRDWISHPPEWLEIHSAPVERDGLKLEQLDPGEREAIELALHLKIESILIDEIDARFQAKRLHLKVKGTLGILEQAARLGRVDFPTAIEKLEATNFRLSSALRDSALRRAQRPNLRG